jgi:hypothetical protein
MHLSGDSARTLLRAEVQASGNRAATNERHPASPPSPRIVSQYRCNGTPFSALPSNRFAAALLRVGER